MFYFTFPLVWGLFYFNIFYLVWAWSSLLQHCWIEVFSVFGSSTLARPRWLDPMARPCWLSSMYSKFFGFFLSNTTFATSLVHGNIFVCYIIVYVACYQLSLVLLLLLFVLLFARSLRLWFLYRWSGLLV